MNCIPDYISASYRASPSSVRLVRKAHLFPVRIFSGSLPESCIYWPKTDAGVTLSAPLTAVHAKYIWNLLFLSSLSPVPNVSYCTVSDGVHHPTSPHPTAVLRPLFWTMVLQTSKPSQALINNPTPAWNMHNKATHSGLATPPRSYLFPVHLTS